MARKRSGLNIYKRKSDGRYEGRYRTVDPRSGAKKTHSVYGKTYKAAADKLIVLLAGKAKPVRKTAMTFGEIANLWRQSIFPAVKISTYANYDMKLRAHILPIFGETRYDYLSADMLDRFISGLLKSGRVRDKTALSSRYVRDIAVLIVTICAFAAKHHGLHNPAADITLPKPKPKESVLLGKNEQVRLQKKLLTAGNLFSAGVLTSLYTGVRIGELCALTWKDIDLNEGVLRVNKTLQRVKVFDHAKIGKNKTELVLTAPKSDMSRRTIPIPDCLLSILKRAKSADNCYVLSGTSCPVEPRTAQNRFKSLLKNARLPSVHFHALRHMFATNCLQCGCDVKTLSEILGHSSVTTTLNRYVHTSDERKRECVNMLKLSA